MKTNAINEYDGAVCIPNISPRERTKRLISGIIPFVIAIAVLIWMISADVDRLWRIPLFLLFAGAASGYFQWSDKTCVGLARLDSRQVTDTMEKIENEAELAQIRGQARKVNIKAFVTAIILTLITLLLPL